MQYDVFFSISQTPVAGACPDEAGMLRNFFAQVEAADRLGYGVAWVAESHLSSEVQKSNPNPVIPHWSGEVGLNCDILQTAHAIFRRTKRIEVGSAVMNILCNGGPVAHAERIAYFLALHGLDANERRRIHIGFSAGRFDFMNRAYGILPQTATERALPFGLWKGQTFREAAEIFARLLTGETLSSNDIAARSVTRMDFRSDGDWDKAVAAAEQDGTLESEAKRATSGPTIVLPKRFIFESLKLIPQEFRPELLQLVVGSHDPVVHDEVNRILPAHVANLSITPSKTIEATHERMHKAFHPAGGPWKRSYMPRTVLVFLNEEPGLTANQRSQAAQEEAKIALAAYWSALEGTLDPKKTGEASDNAVIGNADDVAKQIAARYHPDDRLMLWFDFFNHDSPRVIRNMEAFMAKVAPKLAARSVSA